MSLLHHTPQLSENDAVTLAQTLFALEASAKLLNSERDQNFRLQTNQDTHFVLKIANGAEDRAMLEAQNAAMVHLAARGVTVCPQVFPTVDGQLIGTTTVGESTHFVRLVSYLEGDTMSNVGRHSAEFLHHLGQTVGQIDHALNDFDHPALHYNFHWDLAQGMQVIEQHLDKVSDAEMRGLIERVSAEYTQLTAPLLPTLRQNVIHNDANDNNVILGGGSDLYTRNQAVTGVIDFGDMIYTHRINDLAIAIAYAILDKPDPLATAAHIVRGYHGANPLTDDEFKVLWNLVQMRLCTSVCIAAEQNQHRPDDPYLLISQQPIRNTWPKMAKVHSRHAAAVFRDACGLTPSDKSTRIHDWLVANQANFAPVLDVDMRQEPCCVLDLSIGSPLISGNFAKNDEPFLTPRIWAEMAEAGVNISIGRYDEPRLIYTDDIFKTGDGLLDERRMIHLGFDLFANAGTPVHAPLAGTVHVAKYNPGHLDYGGIIMLAHETEAGDVFYTLYGHLGRASAENLQVGQPIAKGERIAEFGEPHENGGWPPHLHLQIITDPLDLDADFPGVVLASQRNVWRAFSPDPNLLVGVPQDRFPTPDPAPADTLRVRREKIGRNLSLGYRNHLKIVRGWQQYLFDETGQRYLDAYNNVPHVGHAHPRVIAAAERQMRVLNTNTRYLHDSLNRYAERLTATMPDPLNVCYFVNSASEANELALRLARAYTNQRDMIVLEGAYHGHTTGLIDISPYKHDGPGGSGAPDWVHTAPVADVYRGAYKVGGLDSAEKYATHVKQIIDRLAAQGKGIAGYIAETCPSVGGQIIFPQGYLAAAYQHVRAGGGLCIADEVQTGYGRIGSHLYAFEEQNAVPDIVILGKPIGNGHPIGAVVTTSEIANAFDNGMEFFSTFGGNTVSCAVGLAVLDVLQEENLMAHAHTVGNRLLEGLRQFKDRYELVGDVRGSGLFLGIELVTDRETLAPASAEASFISNQMREHGILMGTDGPLHNVIKIRPPMPFSLDNADFLLETIDKVFRNNF
ncbi:MAG: aminotransferase class III-fold pyridoxal phosphate-dependent enzyme [Candidatus Promineifilaceae bacterium]